MRNPFRWIVEYVDQLPQTTKIVCGFSLTLGLTLGWVGWEGDTHGWWDNRAFVTNLVSSFTGLCFAVPFALVIFERLAEPHAIASDKRRAQRRAEFVLARHKAAKDRLGLLSATVKALPDGASVEDIQRCVMDHWHDVEAVRDTWRRLESTVADGLAENHMTLFTSGGLDSYSYLMDQVQRACEGYRNPPAPYDRNELVGLLDFVVPIPITYFDDSPSI
ncbi:hypothetical protein OG495_15275 [Streptomyces longwoodensis]|uniref:hypothetical protein n=1 Tax=Streptomyces longwoodensis TaxID=68231 RepID=UPI00386E3B21